MHAKEVSLDKMNTVVLSKHTKNQIVVQYEDHTVCDSNRKNKRKDLDEESTAQNFMNVAK